MGKRKAKAKTAPRKKVAKLETTFVCPFCGHTDSVECTFDRRLRIAEAACFICGANYATVCHALTEPIDVYAEWIDACERDNEGADLRGDDGADLHDDDDDDGDDDGNDDA